MDRRFEPAVTKKEPVPLPAGERCHAPTENTLSGVLASASRHRRGVSCWWWGKLVQDVDVARSGATTQFRGGFCEATQAVARGEGAAKFPDPHATSGLITYHIAVGPLANVAMCSRCGGSPGCDEPFDDGAVRIIGCIEDSKLIETILHHLGARAAEPEASRLPPCRAAPQARLFS